MVRLLSLNCCPAKGNDNRASLNSPTDKRHNPAAVALCGETRGPDSVLQTSTWWRPDASESIKSPDGLLIGDEWPFIRDLDSNVPVHPSCLILQFNFPFLTFIQYLSLLSCLPSYFLSLFHLSLSFSAAPLPSSKLSPSIFLSFVPPLLFNYCIHSVWSHIFICPNNLASSVFLPNVKSGLHV